MKWKRQPKFIKRRKSNLEANILLNLPKNSNLFKISEAITDFSELVEYICEQTNPYAAQNGREFITNPEETCAFSGKTYINSISMLPNSRKKWGQSSTFQNFNKS